MNDAVVEYPQDFADEESFYEAKGRLVVLVHSQNVTYQVCFYDPVRLAQDVHAELELNGHFYDCNLVVIAAVNRNQIEEQLRRLADEPKQLWLPLNR